MAPRVLVVATLGLLVAMVLSGCQDAPAAKTVEDVFGEKFVIPKNGVPTIQLRVTEGAFISPTPNPKVNETWGFWPNLTLEMDRLDFTDKPDAGPQGGGGGSYKLMLDPKGVQLMLRFKADYDLTGFKTSWTLLDDNLRPTNWTEPLDGPASAPITITKPGRLKVLARVIDAAGVSTNVNEFVTATINAKWEVHSKVFPFMPYSPLFGPTPPAARPPPPNAAEMADAYALDIVSYGGVLQLNTEYDGAWDPAQPFTTDVDLELQDPGKKTVDLSGWARDQPTNEYFCSRQNRYGGFPPVPDPADAREQGRYQDLYTGTWYVHVGFVTCDNKNWEYYYNNQGMVPYKLTALIDFSDENAGGNRGDEW